MLIRQTFADRTTVVAADWPPQGVAEVHDTTVASRGAPERRSFRSARSFIEEVRSSVGWVEHPGRTHRGRRSMGAAESARSSLGALDA